MKRIWHFSYPEGSIKFTPGLPRPVSSSPYASSPVLGLGDTDGKVAVASRSIGSNLLLRFRGILNTSGLQTSTVHF